MAKEEQITVDGKRLENQKGKSVRTVVTIMDDKKSQTGTWREDHQNHVAAMYREMSEEGTLVLGVTHGILQESENKHPLYVSTFDVVENLTSHVWLSDLSADPGLLQRTWDDETVTVPREFCQECQEEDAAKEFAKYSKVFARYSCEHIEIEFYFDPECNSFIADVTNKEKEGVFESFEYAHSNWFVLKNHVHNSCSKITPEIWEKVEESIKVAEESNEVLIELLDAANSEGAK